MSFQHNRKAKKTTARKKRERQGERNGLVEVADARSRERKIYDKYIKYYECILKVLNKINLVLNF